MTSEELQKRLTSNLIGMMEGRGSTLFRLTWKVWATPSGRLVPLQRASARFTYGKDFSSWATPKASDGAGGRTTATKGGGNVHLDKQVRLAGWRTPNASDGERGPHPHPDKKAGQHSLTTEVQQTAGQIPNGSPAQMVNGGQLNPAFPRWLLGYPEDFDKCSPNYRDWEKWQTLMPHLSVEPSETGGDGSKDMEIQS